MLKKVKNSEGKTDSLTNITSSCHSEDLFKIFFALLALGQYIV